ncbi:MAG TPA: CPBP family intramembrane metalloprotease [Kiritimatiellia bacterium]|nr:CPBP family intramembrane metalloprotease [Kiritimatiellia bacterium]
MPAAAHPSWLAALVAGLGILLAAGFAAGFHLAARRCGATPWPLVLAQFAAASPWRPRDLWAVALVLAAAQFLRRFAPPALVYDVLAFQVALLAAILWRMRGKPQALGARAAPRTVLAEAALRWLAILPLIWFLGFAWNLALGLLGREPAFQHAVALFLETDTAWEQVRFVFFAVVVAPVAEEALFRGLLLPLLVRHAGAVAGVALTALGFAALHGLESLPALAVFSVALSLAYARTGTLLVPMAMHAFFNAANLALVAALVRSGALPT